MQHNRRALLRASGLALVGGLAGCSGGSEGTDTEEPTDTETATPTEAPTATPTETATPTPAVPEADTVEMASIAFDPLRVRVPSGIEVEWVNRDGIAHNVVSAQFDDGATEWEFTSENVGEGGTVTYTFESAGAYEYYCSIHGRNAMCGVVLVGDAEPTGPLPCE